MDTQKDNATPRPWNIVKGVSIAGHIITHDNKEDVCLARPHDAELIVRAVNEYDKLKADNEALLKSLKEMTHIVESYQSGWSLALENAQNLINQSDSK